jgi:hypothetical protein
VGPLRVIEEKGPRDGVKHGRGSSADCTTFELGVVLDAYVCEYRNFRAAKPGNASVRTGGKPGLFGGHLRPARHQERAYLGLIVHATRIRPCRLLWGALLVHPWIESPPRDGSHVDWIKTYRRYAQGKVFNPALSRWKTPLNLPRKDVMTVIAIVGAGAGPGVAITRRFGTEGFAVVLKGSK